MHLKPIHKNIIVAVFLLLIFFVLALNPPFRNDAPSALNSQSFESLSALMVSLSEKRDALYNEYDELYAEFQEVEAAQASGRNTLSTLLRRRSNMQLITGVAAVKGQGISISIPQNNKMMKYDLIDMVNELYLSGASVISVNGERINLKTMFDEKYDSRGNNILMLNGHALDYPLVINALGDPATLEKGISYTGGIVSNLNLLYGVFPVITQESELIIDSINLNAKKR